MIITAKNILIELQELWPDLWDIWPMDKEFYCPPYEKVQEVLIKIVNYRELVKSTLLNEGIVLNTEYKAEVHDCDNFSLELQADISRFRLATKVGEAMEAGRKPWAFGTACCIKTNGRRLNHALNICRTSDKEYVFIEPQNNTMWVADKHQDTPYFIEMR